ncbi:MAG: 5-formyltetrahydrofolate cyclo-ligase [Acutalibacteraceae bacterium]|jgi:5-formyltetrahydrofolate cyclo-ligase
MNKRSDIRVIKNQIRSEARRWRESLSEDAKRRLDIKIFNRFINLWQFRDCETLLIYASIDIEVDTRKIIDYALEKGKRVALPRCVEGTRNIEYYLIENINQTGPGAFGVLEPDINLTEKLSVFESSLCVVPGLAYDLQGYRLGFGKGYFDRFLSDNNISTIGICYEECIFPEIPRGRYDKSVDMIITESRVIIPNQVK